MSDLWWCLENLNQISTKLISFRDSALHWFFCLSWNMSAHLNICIYSRQTTQFVSIYIFALTLYVIASHKKWTVDLFWTHFYNVTSSNACGHQNCWNLLVVAALSWVWTLFQEIRFPYFKPNTMIRQIKKCWWVDIVINLGTAPCSQGKWIIVFPKMSIC